jgi:hypothetical protein
MSNINDNDYFSMTVVQQRLILTPIPQTTPPLSSGLKPCNV